MINQERLVEEFLELVQVDSETGNERLIADLLIKKLEILGLDVKEDEAGKKINKATGNLIATLAGEKKVTPIFFGAHMDTVQPGRGVKPILADGVIRSAGATILGGDDKAGIAIILEAIRVLKEQQIAHGNLQIVFTINEEGGLLGAKNLDYSAVRAQFGYVLDSGGKPGSIVVKGPAQDSIEVGIIGKAAHAGMCPEEGISAIQVAAKAIDQLQLGRIDEETTANIGIISGGKATNIVPDLVNLHGEARSLNPEKLDAQVKHMLQVFEDTAQPFGAKVTIKVERMYPELNLSVESPVVQTALTAAKVAGLEAVMESTGGGSDANILTGYGIPTGNLGIAMTKVHTTEEIMAVEDMVNGVKLLVAIAQEVK